MSSKSLGPGVQRFWKGRASGEDVDVEAIIQEYPDEALDLAEAIWEAARREDSVARERMWLARTRVLSRSGEEATLGALLRSSREDAGLSAATLSAKIRERGVALPPTEIDQLEANRAKIVSVKTPGVWLSLAEILQIDPHRLVAMIRAALSGQQTNRGFARMGLGIQAADSKSILGREISREPAEPSAGYIDWVRTELGLPSSPSDTVQ